MSNKRTLFIECRDIVMLVEQTRDELQDLYIHKNNSISVNELNSLVEDYILSYPHKIKCSSTFDSVIEDLKKKFNVVLYDIAYSDAQNSHLRYLSKHYKVDYLSLAYQEFKGGKRLDFSNGIVICSSLSTICGTNYKKLYYMGNSFYRRFLSYLYKDVTYVMSWSSLLRKLGVQCG